MSVTGAMISDRVTGFFWEPAVRSTTANGNKIKNTEAELTSARSIPTTGNGMRASVMAKAHVRFLTVQRTSAIFFKVSSMAPEPFDYRTEKSLRGSGEADNFLDSDQTNV